MLVLISGKQGSGKTTLSDALIVAINRKPSWVGADVTFAEPLYRMHDSCRNVLRDLGVDLKHEKKDGNLLQLLGTDWARNTLGEDIWVNCLKGTMNRLSKANVKFFPNPLSDIVFVVSDCRFKNEFDAFPDALRVRLDCPKRIRKDRVSMWRENDQHPSEIDLDGYAVEERFDLTFRTDELPVNGCVDLIIAQLLKGDWAERRVR